MDFSLVMRKVWKCDRVNARITACTEKTWLKFMCHQIHIVKQDVVVDLKNKSIKMCKGEENKRCATGKKTPDFENKDLGRWS